MYDLECVEVRWRFACIDQFGRHGTCGSNHVDRNSISRERGAVRVGTNEGEFGESRTRRDTP